MEWLRVTEMRWQPQNRCLVRYELPKVYALNFVLYDVLDGGASTSMRLDTQGKLLGTAILELELDDVE